jgi:fluoride exporter
MRTDPVRLAAVAVGGVVGTWARWGISATWPVRADRFPVTTMTINVVGALVLGVVLVALLDRRPARPLAHALVGTGVLGAFTTFSTLAVEVVVLTRLQRFWVAAAYLALSLVLGALAMTGGLVLGRRAWSVS